MLRRFADARLRAELDKTRDHRDRYRDLANAFAERLKVVRRSLTAAEHALLTQVALTGRWKSIAQQAQADLAAERARTQETNR